MTAVACDCGFERRIVPCPFQRSLHQRRLHNVHRLRCGGSGDGMSNLPVIHSFAARVTAMPHGKSTHLHGHPLHHVDHDLGDYGLLSLRGLAIRVEQPAEPRAARAPVPAAPARERAMQRTPAVVAAALKAQVVHRPVPRRAQRGEASRSMALQSRTRVGRPEGAQVALRREVSRSTARQEARRVVRPRAVRAAAPGASPPASPNPGS